MEGGAHAHNHPLLADALAALSAHSASPPPAHTDVVVALLFLSPGRHAGPGGDIAQICGAAEASHPSLCCHLTDLVGTHPLAAPALAAALQNTLSNLHDPNLA
jgi:sirohydrochlorin ferrochelatase